MQGWLKITLVVVVSCAILVSLLIIIIIQKARRRRRRRDRFEEPKPEDMQSGMSELHHVSLHHLNRDGTKKTNYFVFRRGPSTKPYFSWADHPSLVTDAVENGWSQFGFTSHTPPLPVRSARSFGDQMAGVKISWEVSPGSADFMQKIRFRCDSELLKRISSSRNNYPSMAAASVIKTSLPLPGPPLGASSFPQEAYFEITLFPLDDHQDESRKSQDDKIKLISQDSNAKSLIRGNKTNNHHVALSVGLSGRASLPLKLPGSYPGSIGFNSNGSVCLDGVVLVYESEGGEWGRAERVIGCGYNPREKKVFFTVDSQLMHEINCKSDEFGSPLYPTLAANDDIMVVVNLGQSVFKYEPANHQRTPNPCFIGPQLENSCPSSAIGVHEHSKELFSIGRIDSQWLNRSTTATTATTRSNGNNLDFDLESEGELFEIVLEGKKPNT